MANRHPGIFQKTMERIVSKPPLATFTVGTSILILLQVIHGLSSIWPPMGYLRFIVPFIPPFFITRTAKRINQRRAEYDFIKDAEPYIFVAFPQEATVQSLLQTPADMVSDSAARHFNCPLEELLDMTALPIALFDDSKECEQLVQELVNNYYQSGGHGRIQNFRVLIRPHGKEKTDLFIVNSVLTKQKTKLKWQATFMKYYPLPQERN